MAVWVSCLFFVVMGNWCVALRLTVLYSCMSHTLGDIGYAAALYLWFCFCSQGCSWMVESRASRSWTWWFTCVIIFSFLVNISDSFDFLFIGHAPDGHRNLSPELKSIPFRFTRTFFLNSRINARQSYTLTTLTHHSNIAFNPFRSNALLLACHRLQFALLIFNRLCTFLLATT